LEGLDADATVADDMDWTIRLISQIRTVRAEMDVPAKAEIPMILRGASEDSVRKLGDHRDEIMRLARLESVATSDPAAEVPEGSAQIVHGEATIVLPLAGVIDIAQEKARLERERDKVAEEIAAIEKKLANKAFVDKAPDQVVATQHERKSAAQTTLEHLAQALARLG
jgi:valyl-tRNA synthetase